jgi:hypothetical protein
MKPLIQASRTTASFCRGLLVFRESAAARPGALHAAGLRPRADEPEPGDAAGAAARRRRGARPDADAGLPAQPAAGCCGQSDLRSAVSGSGQAHAGPHGAARRACALRRLARCRGVAQPVFFPGAAGPVRCAMGIRLRGGHLAGASDAGHGCGRRVGADARSCRGERPHHAPRYRGAAEGSRQGHALSRILDAERRAGAVARNGRRGDRPLARPERRRRRAAGPDRAQVGGDGCAHARHAPGGAGAAAGVGRLPRHHGRRHAGHLGGLHHPARPGAGAGRTGGGELARAGRGAHGLRAPVRGAGHRRAPAATHGAAGAERPPACGGPRVPAFAGRADDSLRRIAEPGARASHWPLPAPAVPASRPWCAC